MKVYGASVSYYTGKLETYLRYKGIDYERGSPYADLKRIKEAVGCIQHPMVELDDGRWMTDSTPMIEWFESQHPDRPVMPSDPVVRYVALLIEDYADEWLWRPAMHYRWSYEHDRELLSRILADELTTHLKLPRFIRRNMIKQRQRKGFVINDGVTDSNRDHVEAGYFTALTALSEALQDKPFVLGSSPSIADIGLMGPMLRHFGQDPTPAEIMRDKAPVVFDWLSRMWNASENTGAVSFASDVPQNLQALLQEVCETHLVQLAENANAYATGAAKFEMTVQGAIYRNLPVSRYRVYCLEIMRERFANLVESEQARVKEVLTFPDASVLWQDDIPAKSGYDEARQAPFNKAINVFDNGVPS